MEVVVEVEVEVQVVEVVVVIYRACNTDIYGLRICLCHGYTGWSWSNVRLWSPQIVEDPGEISVLPSLVALFEAAGVSQPLAAPPWRPFVGVISPEW